MTAPYVLGFTGSRHSLTDVQVRLVTALVLEFLRLHRVVEARHGCCTGGDEVFHDVCALRDVRLVGHPTSTRWVSRRWISSRLVSECDELLPPIAPLDRNRRIVDVSRSIIAAPATSTSAPRSGTWATIRLARAAVRAGSLLSLHVVTPDGVLPPLGSY